MAVQVAVVFHASCHLTARQARAVHDGVGQVEGARAQLLGFDELREGCYEWTALDKADAIIFGAPTFLGLVPANFRRFREASARRRWKNKLAAGFTCAGSAGDDAAAGFRQFASLAEQHGMRWIEPAGDAEMLGQRVAEAALGIRGPEAAAEALGLSRLCRVPDPLLLRPAAARGMSGAHAST